MPSEISLDGYPSHVVSAYFIVNAFSLRFRSSWQKSEMPRFCVVRAHCGTHTNEIDLTTNSRSEVFSQEAKKPNDISKIPLHNQARCHRREGMSKQPTGNVREQWYGC